MFKEGDLILLYDIKALQHPGNIRMHWLGPYEVKVVMDEGDVQLRDITGVDLIGMINGSQLNMYKDSRPPTA
jgi:hypothetical protein